MESGVPIHSPGAPSLLDAAIAVTRRNRCPMVLLLRQCRTTFEQKRNERHPIRRLGVRSAAGGGFSLSHGYDRVTWLFPTRSISPWRHDVRDNPQSTWHPCPRSSRPFGHTREIGGHR